MRNEQQGAFACASDSGYQQGLTKREYFAAMAMQGILSKEAHDQRIVTEIKGQNSSRTIIAKASVIMADELLKALEIKSE